jgi:hypothetical protein
VRGARLLTGEERSTAVSEISVQCRVDRLADDGGPLLDAALAATGATDPKVRAAWVVGGYAWLLAQPALTAFMRDGRVPDLRPERVAVAAAGDGTYEVVLDDEGAAAALGRCDVARAALVAGLEQNLAAVLALPQLGAIGARLRWLLAADMVAGAALHLGHPLLGRAGAIREAGALCAVPGRLRVPLAVILGGDPAHHPERWRASCCLAHREGHDLCPTCPRRRVSATGGPGGASGP